MILLAVLGGLLVLGLLLLSIPFDLAWNLEFYERPKFGLRWTWGFGLISREIKRGKNRPGPPKEKKKKAVPEKKKKFSPGQLIRRLRMGSEFLQIKGLVQQLLHFFKSTLRCFKIRHMEADMTVGLDEPSETFYLFAVTMPINRWLANQQPFSLYIRPSFIEPIIEGYWRGDVRLYPISLLPPTLRMVFSLPAFRAIKKAVALRWRRNR